MPVRSKAVAVEQFELMIDGQSLGRFEALFAPTAPGAAPRPLQVHELPLLLRISGAQPAPSPIHKIPDIALKRGVCNQALIERWQKIGVGSIVLVGLGSTGKPVARYKLIDAWPMKITGPALHAKGGGEVAVEEIVISHEGMKLD